jgi:ATP-dependent DNA helicase Rep
LNGITDRIDALRQLNTHQKTAAQHVGSPLLVIAGAGSGKTTVIIHKIAWLIREHQISPHRIGAITCTDKAARQMKIHVADLLTGKNTRELGVSTFHTLGLDILHRHLEAAGYHPGFSIYDAGDSRELIGRLSRAEKGVTTELVGSIQHQISFWKSRLAGPDEISNVNSNDDSIEAIAARILPKYESRLQSHNALDLDDLILKPVVLLRDHPEILQYWRERIRYLLADDFQNATASQYALIKLLAGERREITIVGDDDQFIDVRGGAQPEQLKRLKEDYPELVIFRLEQNYRSAGRILKAANSLIAHNDHLFDKRLWCEAPYGASLRVIVGRSEEHEADRVVAELLNHKSKHESEFRDYAILHRQEYQARVFERVLRERRIPFFPTDSTSFFDKTEVRDIMAYFRLLCNPDDDNAFLRVVNTPRREIGLVTLEQLEKHAAEEGAGLLRTSLDPGIEGTVGPRQLTALRAFTQWLADTIDRAKKQDPIKLACDMLAELHYEEWLNDTCNDQKIAAQRMDNVLNLVAWLQRIVRQQGDQQLLPDIVASLSLVGLLDKDSNELNGDGVSLMTLHAAQGMEFPHVFLVGMDDESKSDRALRNPISLEEERRLAYVGMTRAKKSLTFSYSQRRRRGGEIVDCVPSRLFAELPQDDLVWSDHDDTQGADVMLRGGDAYLANLRSLWGDERH